MADVTLKFGRDGEFQVPSDPPGEWTVWPSPPSLPDLGDKVASALAVPLEYPPLAKAVVPGDKVVIALDRGTPEASILVEELWKVLKNGGVEAQDLLILQPPSLSGQNESDPRSRLPKEDQAQVQWRIHDATNTKGLAYLSSTVGGERIYLARELIDADLVLTVGPIEFDPVAGYRGGGSVLYPGLSNVEAIARVHGQGHLELGPDDERPLRQVIDEVTWLLGVQFSLQVVAGDGEGVSAVFAGLDTAVFQKGKEFLNSQRLILTDSRVPVVLVCVDADAGGIHWAQVGTALATARNLVAKGGKIIVLSELSDEPGEGLKLLQGTRHARDILKPLRQQAPPDLITATQVTHAVDWSEVFLMSRLDGTLVDELFMTPIESTQEALRLLKSEETGIVIGGAQHTFGQVGAAP
ncbi:MAG: lactate racemase domain-containing protein [Planctomycetales bacterium]